MNISFGLICRFQTFINIEKTKNFVVLSKQAWRRVVLVEKTQIF